MRQQILRRSVKVRFKYWDIVSSGDYKVKEQSHTKRSQESLKYRVNPPIVVNINFAGKCVLLEDSETQHTQSTNCQLYHSVIYDHTRPYD